MNSSLTIRYHHDIVTVPAKITVSVLQQEKTLYHKVIDLRCFFSPLRIEFAFESLSPLQLKFVTECDALKLFPFYIDRIEFDDLADIPFIAHTGKLMQDNVQIDSGNCLYTRGQLLYNFKLPLCSNCGIV